MLCKYAACKASLAGLSFYERLGKLGLEIKTFHLFWWLRDHVTVTRVRCIFELLYLSRSYTKTFSVVQKYRGACRRANNIAKLLREQNMDVAIRSARTGTARL